MLCAVVEVWGWRTMTYGLKSDFETAKHNRSPLCFPETASMKLSSNVLAKYLDPSLQV